MDSKGKLSRNGSVFIRAQGIMGESITEKDTNVVSSGQFERDTLSIVVELVLVEQKASKEKKEQ